jgi:hypothetical protein
MAYNQGMLKREKNGRIYLINRDFQLRYMGVALAVGAGSTLVTLAVVLIPLFQFKILRFPNFLPMPFMIGMIGAGVCNFFIVGGMSILITHRIAGPMFSMVRYLHLVRERRAVVPLKVRENDDLRFLVRNINDFFEFLNAQCSKDGQMIDQATALLASSQESEKEQGLGILKELRRDLDLRVIPQKKQHDSKAESLGAESTDDPTTRG